MKKITIAIILSLLFHLSQYGLVTYFPVRTPSQNEIDKPVEFEIVENKAEPPTKVKQIVKTIKNQSPSIDMNKPAEFNAEITNRVKEQTRAQEQGQFRNSQQQKQTQRSFDPNGDQFNQQLNMPSRSEYQLPDGIKYGGATNLNTDAYLYASFYNRVTDLFYIRWSQKLNNLWARMSDDAKRGLAGHNWYTDVDIWLDASGKFQKGVIMKNSGFVPFDKAAIFGFQDANFFPNPPKDKIEADGYIHLRYRVNVTVY